MKLQEHHKIFVVECYAQFMKRSDIVEVFIDRFSEDIDAHCAEFQETRTKFIESNIDSWFRDELPESKRRELLDQKYDEIIEPVIRQIKRKLSDRFRRLHIDHSQFPNKYRELFNETRECHLNKSKDDSLHDMQNCLLELENLYNYLKFRIFVENDISQLPLAQQILKTIIACHLMQEQPEVMDIIPVEEKQLSDNSGLPKNNMLESNHEASSDGLL